jgi:hypothetical protein
MNAPAGAYAGRFWYAASPEPGHSGKPALVGVVLPDDQAKRAIDGIKLEEQLLVHAGSRVSLDVSVPGDLQEKVTQSLTAHLKANGVTVVEAQPVKLIARTEPGQTREIHYRHFGAFPSARDATISVTETKFRLAFETSDGKVLWQRQTVTFPPPLLMMKEGQTIEQAVAAAMQPSYFFFERTRLPANVPKSRGGLGSSRLTVLGVQTGN